MASSVSTCFVLFYALGVAGWHVAGYVLHTGCQAMPDQLDAALRAPIALPDVLLVSPAGLLRCSAGDRLSDLLLVRPPPLFNAGHELSRWPADLQSRLSALALGDGLWRLTEALRDARGKTAMPVAPWSGSDLSRMVTALEEGQQRLDGLRLEGDSYRAAAAQLQRLNAAAGQALTLDTVTAYRPRGAAEAALCSDVRRRRAALVAEVAALAEAVRELRGAVEDLSNLTATIDDLLRDVSASVDQLEIAWASSAKGAQAVTERTGQLWREWQRPLEVTGCAAVGTAYRRLVGGLCHEVGSGVLAVAQGYLLQWLALLAIVPVALCAAGPTSGGPRPLPSSPSSASRSSTPSSDWAGSSLLQDNAL